MLINESELVHGNKKHRFPIFSIDYKNGLLASASLNGEIKIKSLNNIHTLKKHSGTVLILRFDPFSNYLASGSDDNSIVIYELKNDVYVFLKKIRKHGSDVSSLAWGVSFLVSCGYDGVVILYSKGTFNVVKRKKAFDLCRGVCIDHVNEHIIVQGDNMLKVFNYALEEIHNVTNIFNLPIKEAFFSRSCLSPDSKFYASSLADNNKTIAIEILTTQDYKRAFSLIGHVAPCEVVIFYPKFLMKEGGVYALLAVGSQDRSISFWSNEKTTPILLIKNIFDQPILDMCWGLRTLYVCSYDGKIRMFEFTEEEIGSEVEELITDAEIIDNIPFGRDNIRIGEIGILEILDSKQKLIQNGEDKVHKEKDKQKIEVNNNLPMEINEDKKPIKGKKKRNSAKNNAIIINAECINAECNNNNNNNNEQVNNNILIDSMKIIKKVDGTNFKDDLNINIKDKPSDDSKIETSLLNKEPLNEIELKQQEEDHLNGVNFIDAIQPSKNPPEIFKDQKSTPLNPSSETNKYHNQGKEKIITKKPGIRANMKFKDKNIKKNVTQTINDGNLVIQKFNAGDQRLDEIHKTDIINHNLDEIKTELTTIPKNKQRISAVSKLSKPRRGIPDDYVPIQKGRSVLIAPLIKKDNVITDQTRDNFVLFAPVLKESTVSINVKEIEDCFECVFKEFKINIKNKETSSLITVSTNEVDIYTLKYQRVRLFTMCKSFFAIVARDLSGDSLLIHRIETGNFHLPIITFPSIVLIELLDHRLLILKSDSKLHVISLKNKNSPEKKDVHQNNRNAICINIETCLPLNEELLNIKLDRKYCILAQYKSGLYFYSPEHKLWFKKQHDFQTIWLSNKNRIHENIFYEDSDDCDQSLNHIEYKFKVQEVINDINGMIRILGMAVKYSLKMTSFDINSTNKFFYMFNKLCEAGRKSEVSKMLERMNENCILQEFVYEMINLLKE